MYSVVTCAYVFILVNATMFYLILFLALLVLTSSRPAVPNLFGTRDLFHGRQFFHGRRWGEVGDGSGGNASDGERWGAADETSLSCPPLISCCAAQFLTGHRPVPVMAQGLGTPALDDTKSMGLAGIFMILYIKK